MPYLTEASVTDPLYKLILRRCRQDYWDCWRTIRESNSTEKIEEEFEMVPNTSLIEEISDAVVNCAKTFFGRIWFSLLLVFNVLKYVLSLGQCQDLFRTVQPEVIDYDKYDYSEEFKDLVF